MSNKELAEELYKPIIKKFQKGKGAHLFQTIFGEYILQIKI